MGLRLQAEMQLSSLVSVQVVESFGLVQHITTSPGYTHFEPHALHIKTPNEVLNVPTKTRKKHRLSKKTHNVEVASKINL